MTGPGSTSKQQSFNFLGLSVDIRCCIYQLLVLVPGLICARQKKTPLVPFFNQAPLHDTKVQHQDLLPGIAYALCHLVSTASKTRFSKLPYTNICILRSCKQVHEEASAVLYGLNIFDLFNHTKETMPKADFKIPLFPHIYQCQIRRLAIKSGGLYMFRFVLLGGWQSLQAAYPALESLTLILEFESSTQGCAIRWARKSGEEWCGYVARVRDELALEIYGCLGLVKTIPDWIGLRMAFNDEKYVDVIDPGLGEFQHDVLDETNRRIVLRRGVVEAFERFRKGSGKR
ncbi:hypothetical protein EJ04DRAFT_423725 [Polyplosphaeria fusca]|uniref:Uncharacterized protein n=1 Tax=Polyplosphaeria fusca TaxID=682080 RepID=A0A9P4RCV9_9PLEO|nr:hypothetical protein EJ04DRAFT_423725 [Polyplosphaeria fusca]